MVSHVGAAGAYPQQLRRLNWPDTRALNTAEILRLLHCSTIAWSKQQKADNHALGIQ